jgi:hypothetical protein
METLDLEITRVRALHVIAIELTRLKWLRDAERLTLAMLRHDRALKYGYNPSQPRDELGKWTDAGLGTEQPSQDHLEQSLATAPDQPERSDLKGLKDVANSATVRSRIDDAWSASTAREGSPQEHGFWITRDNTTGEISTRPFANEGSVRTIVPGPAPEDAIAFFHTHPNRPEDNYVQGPSEGDERFAARTGLPGLIQSHNGMYYFGPALKARAKR